MISSVFDKAKRTEQIVFIPYFPAGYPTIDRSKKAFLKLAKTKAGIIEVGIPFSDPIADGKIIQKASNTALEAGLRIDNVFKMLGSIKAKMPPLVIMTYYNILYRNGIANFARKATKSGVKGVIIPDLTVEEAKDWLRVSKDHLETIFLLAPTSSNERIKKIDTATSSFIYCVSLTGVTGARDKLPVNTLSFLKRVRKLTKKPIAVGFGISKAEHVKQLRPHTDGIIIGSGLISAYMKGKTEKASLTNMDRFIKRLRF